MALTTTTNHTSADLKLFAIVAIVLGLLLLIFYFARTPKDKLILLMSLIAILIGINIFLFDYLNLMVNYEDWLHREMPK